MFSLNSIQLDHPRHHLRRMNPPRQLQQPHLDSHDVDDLDADFQFDDAYWHPRRDRGVSDSELDVDSGGGIHHFCPLDLDHHRGQGNGPRRGAFVRNTDRTWGRTPSRVQPEAHRPLQRRQPPFSSWDRPPHDIYDNDPFRHRSRWDAPSCRDRRVPFSSWDRPRARQQADDDDYEEPRHYTAWDAPRRQETIRAQRRESGWTLYVSSSSVHTSTSPSMAEHAPATVPRPPILVSAAEKAERAKQRLCFYCPEKWVRGHVCQTKLLAYFEDEDIDEQNQDDDRDNDEEKNDAQPEQKGLTEPGVTTVYELPAVEAILPDAEAEPIVIKAELHAEVPKCSTEPVVEVLKPAAQPCMVAASFAFVPLSHDLLQKLPNSGNVGSGIEGSSKHLVGNFTLVGSMERIGRVIDSLWVHVHVSRRVFDPGGDISPPSPFCFTSPRCSWFIATWYSP